MGFLAEIGIVVIGAAADVAIKALSEMADNE